MLTILIFNLNNLLSMKNLTNFNENHDLIMKNSKVLKNLYTYLKKHTLDYIYTNRKYEKNNNYNPGLRKLYNIKEMDFIVDNIEAIEDIFNDLAIIGTLFDHLKVDESDYEHFGDLTHDFSRTITDDEYYDIFDKNYNVFNCIFVHDAAKTSDHNLTTDDIIFTNLFKHMGSSKVLVTKVVNHYETMKMFVETVNESFGSDKDAFIKIYNKMRDIYVPYYKSTYKIVSKDKKFEYNSKLFVIDEDKTISISQPLFEMLESVNVGFSDWLLEMSNENADSDLSLAIREGKAFTFDVSRNDTPYDARIKLPYFNSSNNLQYLQFDKSDVQILSNPKESEEYEEYDKTISDNFFNLKLSFLAYKTFKTDDLKHINYYKVNESISHLKNFLDTDNNIFLRNLEDIKAEINFDDDEFKTVLTKIIEDNLTCNLNTLSNFEVEHLNCIMNKRNQVMYSNADADDFITLLISDKTNDWNYNDLLIYILNQETTSVLEENINLNYINDITYVYGVLLSDSNFLEDDMDMYITLHNPDRFLFTLHTYNENLKYIRIISPSSILYKKLIKYVEQQLYSIPVYMFNVGQFFRRIKKICSKSYRMHISSTITAANLTISELDMKLQSTDFRMKIVNKLIEDGIDENIRKYFTDENVIKVLNAIQDQKIIDYDDQKELLRSYMRPGQIKFEALNNIEDSILTRASTRIHLTLEFNLRVLDENPELYTKIQNKLRVEHPECLTKDGRIKFLESKKYFKNYGTNKELKYITNLTNNLKTSIITGDRLAIIHMFGNNYDKRYLSDIVKRNKSLTYPALNARVETLRKAIEDYQKATDSTEKKIYKQEMKKIIKEELTKYYKMINNDIYPYMSLPDENITLNELKISCKKSYLNGIGQSNRVSTLPYVTQNNIDIMGRLGFGLDLLDARVLTASMCELATLRKKYSDKECDFSEFQKTYYSSEIIEKERDIILSFSGLVLSRLGEIKGVHTPYVAVAELVVVIAEMYDLFTIDANEKKLLVSGEFM